MNKKKKLTNNAGAPVAHNNNVMTAGKRGPMLLQDVWYLEKLAQFDREVIPERRMHAKGSGAYGTFTVTHDITQYTKAKIFSTVGKKTAASSISRLHFVKNEHYFVLVAKFPDAFEVVCFGFKYTRYSLDAFNQDSCVFPLCHLGTGSSKIAHRYEGDIACAVERSLYCEIVGGSHGTGSTAVECLP